MGIAADLVKGALARSAIPAPLPSDPLKRIRFGERMPSAAKLVVRDVSKIYELNARESIAALENVSFSVRKNEILSLLGPSGCGKSTLLRIMAGLDQATSGEVTLDGEPILRPSRACGMVFQTYTSFPWLTVLKNVEYGLKINGVGREERRARAEAFIERVHLSKVKHAYPTQLSGGMKQRVAIARMLANSPEIALMDEPFGALDAETRRSMQELLKEVIASTEMTAVLVTHDITEALFLADRIVFMSRHPGRVREIISLDFKSGQEITTREQLFDLPEHAAYERHILGLMREVTA
jgi:NitT/TauT family transport system ATP-binding protein